MTYKFDANKAQWLLVAVLMTSTACKQLASSDGDLQTIENLSRNDVNNLKLNSCGVQSALSADKESLVSAIVVTARGAIEGDSGLQNDLRVALRSVPQSILKMFHTDLKGHFVVDAAKAKICAASLTPDEKRFLGEAGSEAPIACWHAATNAPPVVYLGAGKIANHDVSLASNIKHNTVRMLAYVYSQYIPAQLQKRVAEARAGSASLSAADASKVQQIVAAIEGVLAKFEQNRQALSAALFSDLRSVRSPAEARLKSFESSSGSRFRDFVLAEAIDSYYCSPGTRASFAQSTAQTARAFGPIQAELDK